MVAEAEVVAEVVAEAEVGAAAEETAEVAGVAEAVVAEVAGCSANGFATTRRTLL